LFLAMVNANKEDFILQFAIATDSMHGNSMHIRKIKAYIDRID
jgi:hypothetical protein